MSRYQRVNPHQRVDIEVFAERAEVCTQQQKHIAAYDWVFTRYVAAIQDSAAYCIPLLKPTGKWVLTSPAMKLSRPRLTIVRCASKHSVESLKLSIKMQSLIEVML